jgi:hypothetical protein
METVVVSDPGDANPTVGARRDCGVGLRMSREEAHCAWVSSFRLAAGLAARLQLEAPQPYLYTRDRCAF